ncbi:MAG: FGGY family carbohydrate kinase [Chloroflexota bacterium]
MSVLGLDIGTSATKGVLLDDRGRVLAQARRGYRTRAPMAGRAELSAPRVWLAVRDVLRTLAAEGERAGSPVRAVCAGGSGDEVVALDARGHPVAPVIMAADDRSAAEGAAIADVCGGTDLFVRTGLWDLAATPAVRWHWMGRHEPMRAARVVRLLSWPEWVMTRLGLPPVTDPTLAARTLAFDVQAGAYASLGCPPMALPDGLLSPVVPTGSDVGGIPAGSARGAGLRPGTRYVVGGFDQAMATLGAGAIEPGIAHDGNGSWEALSLRVRRATIDPRLGSGGWSVGPAASGPSLEVMGSWRGGLALGRRSARSSASLDALAERLASALRELLALGLPVTRIRATGGGAASERWLQLKADATGVPVERTVVRQAGALAAAMLAGGAIGALPSIDEAARMLVAIDLRCEPRPGRSGGPGRVGTGPVSTGRTAAPGGHRPRARRCR